MKYKVKEIYVTRQGEGFWTGREVVLVRFAGCNLNCRWCDTDWKDGEELGINQLVDKIYDASEPRGSVKSVLLTGGEPLLQPEFPDLTSRLRGEGYWVGIETNGTRDCSFLRTLERVDWISVSPKKFEVWTAMRGFLKRGPDEIRIVNDGSWSAAEICLFGIKFLHCKHLYISPLALQVESASVTKGYKHSSEIKGLVQTIEDTTRERYQMFNWLDTIKLLVEVNQMEGGRGWGLSIQTHKMCGLR